MIRKTLTLTFIIHCLVSVTSSVNLNAQVIEYDVPADGPLVQFTIMMGEVTRNIVAAATGQPTDPMWNEVGGGGDGINTTSPETLAEIEALGGTVEVMLTVLELEAVANDTAGGPHYLRTMVAVDSTENVYLVEASLRTGEIHVTADEGLAQIAPPLAGAVNWLVGNLGSADCAVPLLSELDLTAYPEDFRDEISLGQEALSVLCAQMNGLVGNWLPRVDDVTVIARVGDEIHLLRSGFEFNDGHLSLTRVRFR